MATYFDFLFVQKKVLKRNFTDSCSDWRERERETERDRQTDSERLTLIFSLFGSKC